MACAAYLVDANANVRRLLLQVVSLANVLAQR